MIYQNQNLTVESELKIIELHHMEICEMINEHTNAILSGICESGESGNDAGRKITISHGKNGIVFIGKVCRLELHRIGGMIYFKLHACSFSSLLDCNVMTRVIQNQNRSYREVLALIMKPYPLFSFDGGINLNSKFPPFVVQKQETDWEFIKRLVSQIGQGVSFHCASEQIQFFAGQTGEEDELIEVECWKKTFQPECGKELLRIKTKKRYHPGYRLHFQGKWYYVEACDCRLVQSEIFYDLQLVQENGGQTAPQGGLAQEGIRLSAYVKEVDRNQIRLCFENEDFSEDGELPWFPYSGEVNNEAGFYMPQQGAKVEVICTDLYGSSAVVTGAMRCSSKQNTVGNAADKSMKNEHGIGFELGEAKVRMWAGESNQMVFLADGSVALEAEQIQLEAKKSLMLGSSNAHISVKAERSMCIVSGKDGCGQILFDTGGNIRCKSTAELRYKSGISTNKSCGSVKKMEKGLRESTMAMAGTEFLAQSIADEEIDLTENYIKDTILNKDERLFCRFSYGENKNGG